MCTPKPPQAASLSGLDVVEAARRLAVDGPNPLPGSTPRSQCTSDLGMLTEPMFLMRLPGGCTSRWAIARQPPSCSRSRSWSSASRWRRSARRSAARELGSLVAALGGLDVLVFSAGIGEHSAQMRQRICAYAEWPGMELDPAANASHASRISANNSAVDVLVIPTNEELVSARAAQAMT